MGACGIARAGVVKRVCGTCSERCWFENALCIGFVLCVLDNQWAFGIYSVYSTQVATEHYFKGLKDCCTAICIDVRILGFPG